MLNTAKPPRPADPLPNQVVLKELLAKGYLPVISASLSEIEKAMASDKASVDEVVAILQKYPEVIQRIMLTVNSVLYKGKQDITELAHAVNRLGISKVRNIVHAATLHANIKSSPRVDIRVFWKQAILAGFAAKLLAEYYNKQKSTKQYVDADMAFLGGLSRDFGAIFLDLYFDASYKQALGFSPRDVEEIVHNEIFRKGTSHSVISAAALAFWKFPPAVVMGVAGHHNIDRVKDDYKPLAQIIYLSEAAAHYLGYSNGVFNAKLYKVSDRALEVLDAFHMPLTDYKDLMNNAVEITQASDMLQMFS